MSDVNTHILKINWANKHLERLDRAITAWFDGNSHFSHKIDPDPDNPQQFFLKVSADDIPVDPLSLVIGDIVQNIRSSLDHIAYALAVDYTKPLTEKDAAASQFPIFGDENGKGVSGQGTMLFRNGALPRMIKCIDPNAQAFIGNLQPYRLGVNFRDHPLWWLQKLSNIDKHRVLHIGAAFTTSYTVKRCYVEGVFTNEPGIVKGETVVARLGNLRPIDPDRTVEMNVIPNMTVAFSDGELVNKLVVPTLLSISDFVSNKVLTPLHENFLLPSS